MMPPAGIGGGFENCWPGTLRVGTGAGFLAGFLLAFLIGLEANSLRGWTLSRRKPAVDVVMGSDFQEAETKALSRWLAGPDETRGPQRAGAHGSVPHRRLEPVIGLFPDAEGRR